MTWIIWALIPAYFHTVPAAESGIVEYYVDGFEDLSAENVTMDNFKRNNYNKNSIRSGEAAGEWQSGL